MNNLQENNNNIVKSIVLEIVQIFLNRSKSINIAKDGSKFHFSVDLE